MNELQPDESLPSAPPELTPTGVIGMLAQRRQEIVNEQVLSYPISRWTSPRLVAHFRPIEHKFLKRGAETQERVNKDHDADRSAATELDTNADVLINACIDIVAVLPDGTEVGVGPNGRKTQFDMDMAIALGMPENAGTRAVCKAVFITDGDLLAAAKRLGEWSGYREQSVDESLVGES